jgi:hypothetical protein
MPHGNQYFNNYDLFNENKVPVTTLPIKQVRSQILATPFNGEFTPPVYIGQNLYIRPGYIVSLPEFSYSSAFTSEAFRKNQKNLLDKAHNGVISQKADKKIRNAINWLLCAAEPKKVYVKKTNSWFDFKVNFITLTLPDTANEITDYVFKTKLLNPWLTYCRKYFGLKNYVWKIEFQKNGKLHLHITTDTFIHHAKIKSSWNRLLGSNGFLLDFYKKFGHSKPNSTDIHSVRKIRNLGAYLAKYMSKKLSDTKKLRGRIWGCNFEIARANKTTMFIDRNECHSALKPLMQKKIEWYKMQMVDKKTGLLKDRGEIFYLTMQNWLSDISGTIKEKFTEVVLGLKNIYHDGTLFKEMAVI